MVTKCLQLTLIVWPRFQVNTKKWVSGASLKQAHCSLVYVSGPSTSSVASLSQSMLLVFVLWPLVIRWPRSCILSNWFPCASNFSLNDFWYSPPCSIRSESLSMQSSVTVGISSIVNFSRFDTFCDDAEKVQEPKTKGKLATLSRRLLALDFSSLLLPEPTAMYSRCVTKDEKLCRIVLRARLWRAISAKLPQRKQTSVACITQTDVDSTT